MRRAVCGVALAVAACVAAGGVFAQTGPEGGTHAVEVAQGYLLLAEQGEASAQFRLGVRYETGDGVEKNAAEAVK